MSPEPARDRPLIPPLPSPRRRDAAQPREQGVRPPAAVSLPTRENRVSAPGGPVAPGGAGKTPGGGLAPGGDPRAGARRDRGGEPAIPPGRVEPPPRLERTLFYDLPADLVGKLW